MKKFLFGVREFAWMVADEIADWLYPYRNELTPEEKFEVRVKDPMSGEMWMIEELIQLKRRIHNIIKSGVGKKPLNL